MRRCLRNSSPAIDKAELMREQGGTPEEQQGLLDTASCSTAMDAHTDEMGPLAPGVRRYWVFVFSLVTALLCADQNLLAPHLTQAAHDFAMNAAERDQYLGGYIMASFFAIGAPASLLVGYLADRCNRRNLFFCVVMIGATPCLATYWVTQFWQLLVLRTLTGISVGGVAPLIFSLLGDLFPNSERCTMAAFIGVCAGVGGTCGQAISDLTGATNWRIPFVVVSAPTILMACIMMATTQDPPRGCYEEALQGVYAGGDEYKETISWPKIQQLLSITSNWIIFLQGLPGCLPWGMIITFLNDYLAQEQGFSVHRATTIVLVYGLGGILGSMLGGALGQWLYNRRKEWMPLLVGSAVISGTWPLYWLVNTPLHTIEFNTILSVAALGGMMAGMAAPNIRAATINVNQPETRGVAFALQTMTDDLGKGLGPFIVAWFIKAFGRRQAFNAAIAGWVPCGIMLMSLVFCMPEDEAAMQRRLQGDGGFANGKSKSASYKSASCLPPYPDDPLHDRTDTLLIVEDARMYLTPSHVPHPTSHIAAGRDASSTLPQPAMTSPNNLQDAAGEPDTRKATRAGASNHPHHVAHHVLQRSGSPAPKTSSPSPPPRVPSPYGTQHYARLAASPTQDSGCNTALAAYPASGVVGTQVPSMGDWGDTLSMGGAHGPTVTGRDGLAVPLLSPHPPGSPSPGAPHGQEVHQQGGRRPLQHSHAAAAWAGSSSSSAPGAVATAGLLQQQQGVDSVGHIISSCEGPCGTGSSSSSSPAGGMSHRALWRLGTRRASSSGFASAGHGSNRAGAGGARQAWQ